jgi:hypothetical protein
MCEPERCRLGVEAPAAAVGAVVVLVAAGAVVSWVTSSWPLLLGAAGAVVLVAVGGAFVLRWSSRFAIVHWPARGVTDPRYAKRTVRAALTAPPKAIEAPYRTASQVPAAQAASRTAVVTYNRRAGMAGDPSEQGGLRWTPRS